MWGQAPGPGLDSPQPLKQCVFFFFFRSELIYLFMTALVFVVQCAQAFSSCGEWGLLYSCYVVYGLLIAMASLVAEHGL